MDQSNNTSNENNQYTPMENNLLLEDWIPRIGMEFNSVDDAWNFWLEYGGKLGFNVRKHYMNKNKNGDVSSRRFLCAKEGRRKPNKEGEIVCRRSETRTGCKVRLGISLMKETGKYIVHDFVSEHNHVLHTPETTHLLSSQRKITNLQAVDIDFADDSGIKPKVAHELLGAYVGGSTNLGYTHLDHKNYLRTKRQREMKYGEAGSLLNYFHLQTVENPSFQYSLQLDNEEQITNIFWADAKMLIDYASFGDVVAFDTTFGTNKDSRPLGVFVGFNHFREIVIFGATLLYDETVDSFKWLFETFLSTYDNKHPKTIFTDQDIAMGKAIGEIMPNTWHGLCAWHIMENAAKHLMHAKSNVLQDFQACMYTYEDEQSFEAAFASLRGKVDKSTWLNSIYALKKKWAECYMKDVFSLGMRSTQLSESFNKDLKEYLHCNMDVMRFFKQFERILRQKRQKEINSEFDAREKLPRIKMQRTPLLRQAGELYTPKVFEAFQEEYEWSTAAYLLPRIEGQQLNEYRVAISNLDSNNIDELEFGVSSDLSTQTVSCSCRMFERLGILCAHALKVLDVMNIKLVPEKYILKRWTKEARCETVHDINGRVVVEDPKLDAHRRFRTLCQKFVKVASRAANFEEASKVLDQGLNRVVLEVESMLSSFKKDDGVQQVIPEIDVHGNIRLKKKEGKRGGKRKKAWNEKLHKRNKKGSCPENVEKQPIVSKSGKKRRKNQSSTEYHENAENHDPQGEGSSQVSTQAQSSLFMDNNIQDGQLPSNSYTQLLLGQCNGIEAASHSLFWMGNSATNQDMSLQSTEVASQNVMRDLSNARWLGYAAAAPMWPSQMQRETPSINEVNI